LEEFTVKKIKKTLNTLEEFTVKKIKNFKYIGRIYGEKKIKNFKYIGRLRILLMFIQIENKTMIEIVYKKLKS